MYNRIKNIPDNDNDKPTLIIIDDCRFDDEYDMIKDFDRALTWFRINNPEAYMALLD